jgi:hypothetical protein
VPGITIGALYGTWRTDIPRLFAIVSSVQWFTAGTTFWAVRSGILDQTRVINWWNITRGAPLREVPDTPPTQADKIRASTISGGITGAVMGMVFRGPRNVIPGSIMFTLFGYTGQHAYNFFDRRNTEKLIKQDVEKQKPLEEQENLNWLQRVAKKKWSPFSNLTDEQYESMLNEKLLGIDADIALLDEKIARIRQEAKEMEKQQLLEKMQNQGKK